MKRPLSGLAFVHEDEVGMHREAAQQAVRAKGFIDHYEEGNRQDLLSGRKWIQPMIRDPNGPRVQSPHRRKAPPNSPITHTQQLVLPPKPGTPKAGVIHTPEMWGKRVRPKHSASGVRQGGEREWWSRSTMEVVGGSAAKDSKHIGAHLAGGHTVIRAVSSRNNIRPVSAHYELQPRLQQVFETRLKQRDRGAVFSSRIAKRNKGHAHYTDKHMWSQVNSKLPMIG
jgi:hypothetical protein